jgi:chromatin segregation and condensation protein Rec8/ScpA/Scc1 (kleisin family)
MNKTETWKERFDRVAKELRQEREEREEFYRQQKLNKSTYVPTEEHKRIMEQALARDYTYSQSKGWSTE